MIIVSSALVTNKVNSLLLVDTNRLKILALAGEANGGGTGGAIAALDTLLGTGRTFALTANIVDAINAGLGKTPENSIISQWLIDNKIPVVPIPPVYAYAPGSDAGERSLAWVAGCVRKE